MSVSQFFDVGQLKTNNRGLSKFEYVCVHEDGFEAKVGVPDSYCMYGKGTLHLYVAQKNRFMFPEIVAAYISHVFLSGDVQKNTDLFFDGQLHITIPPGWIIDGQAVHEQSCTITCARSDTQRSRYKTRGILSDPVHTELAPQCINTNSRLEKLVKERVQNRVYQKDLNFVVSSIVNAISSTIGLDQVRSSYDRAITICLESKDIKPLIDKPSRDKVRQNYRASDHIRNHTRNIGQMIRNGGYRLVRG